MGGLIVIIGMFGSALTLLLALLKIVGLLPWSWASILNLFLLDLAAVVGLMSLGIYLENNSRAAIFVSRLFRRWPARSASSSGSWG